MFYRNEDHGSGGAPWFVALAGSVCTPSSSNGKGGDTALEEREGAASPEGAPVSSSGMWAAPATSTRARRAGRRVSPDGELGWMQAYGDRAGAGHNATEFVGLTRDGGYMLFNDTDSAGPAEPNNFGFMKLSASASDAS